MMLTARLLVFAVAVFAFGPQFLQAQSIPVTGKAVPGLESFDQLMVEFLKEHGVNGASLAVSRKGELVYSRGFGYQDEAQQEKVRPTTRFRIASLSKPITAAAILSLVADESLSLDDKLTQFLGEDQLETLHDDLREITVRQLLHHRAGWDRNESYDPMFKTVMIGKELMAEGPADQGQIIEYMLQQPLDFSPGTKYAYSNFGYCLLGRIIEQVSGMSYEQYVQQVICRPLKIRSFELGETLQRAKRETRYHTRADKLVAGVVPGVLDQQVPWPYGGWCLENMDSHGGWIASAADLVRFADAYGDPGCLPFLNQALIDESFQRADPKSDQAVHYGLGWSVRQLDSKDSAKINAWHTGSLSGTSTLLVRRHDGLTWAVLFNGRNGANGKTLSSSIDSLVHKAANKVKAWPGQ